MTEAQKEMVVVAEVPQAIHSKWATVAVNGWEHISARCLKMIAYVLGSPSWEEYDHGVRHITLRTDGLPVVEDDTDDGFMPLALAFPDTRSIAINLVKHFEVAVTECKKQPGISILAAYLMNLIVSMAHETHHLSLRLEGHKEADEDEENEAKEFSMSELFALAKMVPLEPEAWIDEPFFAEAAAAQLADDEDQEWAKSQMRMLENRIFMDVEFDGVRFKAHTFKQYLHFQSQEDPDDEKWLTETGESPIMVAPLIAAASETPVPQAVISQPAGKVINLPMPEPTIPIVTPAADTEPAPYVDEEFDGGPELDDDDMGYLFDDSPQLANVAQPQPNVPEPPQPTPVAGVNQPQDIPAAGPARQVYPNHNIDAATMGNTIFGVYNKIYNHLFEVLFKGNPTFQDPDRVGVVPIELTELEKKVVVKCDCRVNTRWCPNTPTSNGLLGDVTSKAKLPQYKIYINDNGVENVRLVMPQNPNTTSKTAELARQGNKIMWVLEGNDAIKAANNSKGYLWKCINGHWEKCK